MSGKSRFKVMLAEAALPEAVVPICMRGDLAAEHELAERELKQAQRTAADSITGNGVGEIAERIEGLEAQMREYTANFRLRALPKRKWRALVDAHPPRRGEDNEILDEDGLGVDSSTFFVDMIMACLVDPVLDDDDRIALFGHSPAEEAALKAEGREDEIHDGFLTDKQFDDLWEKAWALNRREISIPFSLAASRMKRDSAAE